MARRRQQRRDSYGYDSRDFDNPDPRATLDAQVSESDFMAQIKQLAELCGWHAYHTYNSRRSAAGFPDLVLAREGRIIFAELKTQRGQLTPEQDDWLAALAPAESEFAAHEVAVWRPSDWDEIELRLRRECRL